MSVVRAARRRLVTGSVAFVTSVAVVATLGAVVAPGAAAKPDGPSTRSVKAVTASTFAFSSRFITAPPGAAGERLAVTIGDRTHAAPAPSAWACPTGVWVLTLDRKTLEPLSSEERPLCRDEDSRPLEDMLKALPPTRLVIVNAVNHDVRRPGPAYRGLSDALAQIGAARSDFAGLSPAAQSFSVVGVSGMPEGQAFSARDTWAAESTKTGVASAANVRGTLAPDSRDDYTVVMLDYSLYDISADGTIKVDDKTYPVPSQPGFAGGFHVVVLDRRTLAPISDTLYSTNNDLVGQYRMGSELNRMADIYGEGAIVLLATVGKPWGQSFLPAAPPMSGPCQPEIFRILCTYGPTGNEQTIAVPAAGEVLPGVPVDRLEISARGARGGNVDYLTPVGGTASVVSASLPLGGAAGVKPGTTLYVEVGGDGQKAYLQAGPGGLSSYGAGGAGGWNGGAAGGNGSDFAGGGGGGGASDVRTRPSSDPTSSASRLVVAAGGGGAGRVANGGAGGQDGVAYGSASPGHAGTATAGGEGGGNGDSGRLGAGGVGGAYGVNNFGGGGGGSGLYGGGGGANGGGGGGGSNLTPGGTASIVADDQRDAAFVKVAYPSKYGPTLAQTLHRFGATPTLINDLGNTPRYALMGSPDPSAPNFTRAPPVEAVEASASITPGATGAIQGVLARGSRNMWYGPQASNTPAVTSVNGTQRPPSTVNFELYDVISHAHQSWPIPSGRPGEAVHDAQQKAWTYVSDRLCKCPDIRVQYSGNQDLIKQWARDLNTITNPGGQGFDDPTLAVVKTQMQVELDDVDLVAGLQLRMVNLRGLQNQTLDQALKDALKDVQNTLRVPTDKSWAGPLAGAALSATAAVAPLIIKALIGAAAASASAGPIGAAIGIVAAVIGLVIALVSNALSKTPPDKAKVSAEQLAQETTRRFVEGLNSVGQAFDLIYDDWGKLARVGEGLRSGSGWDIRQDQVGRLVSQVSDATKLGYYRTLLPLNVELAQSAAEPSGDPKNWCYTKTSACSLYKYSDYGFQIPDSAYSYPVHSTVKGYQDAYVAMAVRPQYDTYAMPSEVMNRMVAVGLFKPYLFLRFALPIRECVRERLDGYSFDAC